jgi:hypothetical protein
MSIWLDENPQKTTSTSEVLIDSWLLYISKSISFIDEEKEVDDKVSLSLLSESSLAKDWLKSEEDEAWKDL